VNSLPLTDTELVEIRARQRTFEGAYWRTCLASFNFALIVLRVFDKSFFKIGIVFIVYGGVMLFIAAVRRQRNLDAFDKTKPFVTSGGYVVFSSLMALVTYLVLLVLIINLEKASG